MRRLLVLVGVVALLMVGATVALGQGAPGVFVVPVTVKGETFTLTVSLVGETLVVTPSSAAVKIGMIVTVTEPAPSTSTGAAATANRNANLRSGPGTSFAVAGSVTAGQALQIVGQSDDGSWYQLADGKWIAAFLVDGAPAAEAAPTATVAPTKAAMPTKVAPTATPMEEFQTSDLPTLILAPVAEVEAILGEPSFPAPFNAGDIMGYAGAGEGRDYEWGGYWITCYYDTDGIVRGLQVTDGLDEQGYKLAEWPKVTVMFGLPASGSPDVAAPAAVRWDDLDGFKVDIFADGMRETSVIWSIQIFATE